MLLQAVKDNDIFTLVTAPAPGAEKGEAADFHIRAIPPKVWRQFAADFGIEKTSRKEQLTKRPVPGQWRRYQEMYAAAAAYALIDSNPKRRDDRKAELPVLTTETAELLSEELGQELKVGPAAAPTIVTMDGHWSDKVKKHVFLDVPGGPDLADWICKQAKKLGLDISEDEEGKD